MKSARVLIPNVLPWAHSDCQDYDTFSSGSCPLEWLHFLHLSPLCFSACSSQAQGHLLEGALIVPPNHYQASPLCSYRWLLYFDTSTPHVPSHIWFLSISLELLPSAYLSTLLHHPHIVLVFFLSLWLFPSSIYICTKLSHPGMSYWYSSLIPILRVFPFKPKFLKRMIGTHWLYSLTFFPSLLRCNWQVKITCI